MKEAAVRSFCQASDIYLAVSYLRELKLNEKDNEFEYLFVSEMFQAETDMKGEEGDRQLNNLN